MYSLDYRLIMTKIIYANPVNIKPVNNL